MMKAESDDEVVRLRTSNAMERVARENKGLVVPYLDAMMNESLYRQKPKIAGKGDQRPEEGMTPLSGRGSQQTSRLA